MKIDNGNIVINVYDLIGQIPAEQREQIIDSLACQDEVINEVMNQVIDGFTTLGSHAGTTYGGDVDAVYGIDGARMRIAKASSEIAAKEIERLGVALAREKAHSNDGWAKYHKLLESHRRYA
jgi:hypothetical protein